ncbi:hypothetical protein [Mucilaginibacter sp.]
MSKHSEKLKKQLLEVSEIINAFQSEAVQVRLIDRLLDNMVEWDTDANDTPKRIHSLKNYNEEDARNSKKMGATKVLNQLLNTDFFDQPHSIAGIAEYCKAHFNTEFKTSELSGILLKLANENKLVRERSNDSNRFEYVKAS